MAADLNRADHRRTLVFVGYTFDLENTNQDIDHDLSLPYRVNMAARLTEEEIQDRDCLHSGMSATSSVLLEGSEILP
jgi:hypothetical protein